MPCLLRLSSLTPRSVSVFIFIVLCHHFFFFCIRFFCLVFSSPSPSQRGSLSSYSQKHGPAPPPPFPPYLVPPSGTAPCRSSPAHLCSFPPLFPARSSSCAGLALSGVLCRLSFPCFRPSAYSGGGWRGRRWVAAGYLFLLPSRT